MLGSGAFSLVRGDARTTNTDDPLWRPSAGGAKGESVRVPAKRVRTDRGGGLGEGTHAVPELPFPDPLAVGVRPLPQRSRQRQDWRDKHLRCCLGCGKVWRRRRRKTCPECGHADLAFCLTCDRVNPEAAIRERCPPPGEDLRRLVKAYAGDWEWARRALRAARGNVARALVAAERHRPQGGG